MPQWYSVAKVGDVKEGEGIMCPLRGRPVGLWLYQGKYYALEDRCPHRGALLSEGECKNGIVTCAWHAWQFDIKDGYFLENPEIKLKCFPVKVDGEDIYIQS